MSLPIKTDTAKAFCSYLQDLGGDIAVEKAANEHFGFNAETRNEYTEACIETLELIAKNMSEALTEDTPMDNFGRELDETVFVYGCICVMEAYLPEAKKRRLTKIKKETETRLKQLYQREEWPELMLQKIQHIAAGVREDFTLKAQKMPKPR